MVNIFNTWKVALLLGAGLLLFAACAVDEPATDPTPVVPDSTIQATNDGTVTPHPTDTPVPAETPASNDSGGTVTPEPTVGRRSIPDSDTTTRRIPDTPVPEPAQLLPINTLALVLAVSGGSSSGTLKTIVNDSTSGAMLGTKFIQLESSSKSVVLYVPDTGETTVIDSYSSPSYAPHFKRPYTVDDVLYVSNKFTDGGAMSITQYDTDDFSREAE